MTIQEQREEVWRLWRANQLSLGEAVRRLSQLGVPGAWKKLSDDCVENFLDKSPCLLTHKGR